MSFTKVSLAEASAQTPQSSPRRAGFFVPTQASLGVSNTDRASTDGRRWSHSFYLPRCNGVRIVDDPPCVSITDTPLTVSGTKKALRELLLF